MKLPSTNVALLQRLQHLGPRCINTLDAAEDLLASMGLEKLNEIEVAHALLFMAFSWQNAHYHPQYLISAICGKARVKRLDWQMVVTNFDMPELQLDEDAFLSLLKALLPLASREQTFDIQAMWGGSWQHPETQLSFLKAFLLSNDECLSPDKIPRFTYGFSKDAFQGLSNDDLREIETLLSSHVVSLPALSAFFGIALESDQTASQPDSQELINLLERNLAHVTRFVLSAPNFTTATPWTDTQQGFFSHCLLVFLQKETPNHALVLDKLFQQDAMFVFHQCFRLFTQDPMRTDLITETSEELGWTSTFLKVWGNPLAIDMACLRHREDADFDMDKYLQELAEELPNTEKNDVGTTLNKFIRIKADDELRTQRGDQEGPRSVPLALKTVYALLCVLEDHSSRPDNLAPTQRVCLQAYPRLINYGEGFDEILDRTHDERGNKLPEEIDRRMSELFAKMYRGDLKIREVVESMRKLKTSQNPDDQDLFCCIVHGLFEEYTCLHEYPDDALATTAVLFGSIVNYRLVSSIPLQVALALVLDAVQTSNPDQSRFKFGVEALEQLRDRLPEWPSFCALLIEVPSLERSDLAQQARDILRERGHEGHIPGALSEGGVNGGPVALTNGAYSEAGHHENGSKAFRSVRADQPPKGRFKEPDASLQEKLLFVINNTSNDNLVIKVKDLEALLQREHYQWFAAYLVEQRARLEPNNQEMYVRLLELLDEKELQFEVLRETYVCTLRVMNADTTINSASERAQLKHLGSWLGSLTIAKDVPIKHKNIYFTELLLEGHVTDRLTVVVPFTCKTLAQGARSRVFKPPNPWLMEIIELLMEIYDNVVDLKLNLKFEIEVLCQDMGLDHKRVTRSTILQDRSLQFDDSITNASIQAEAVEFFEDMPLNGINRGIRQRLSIETVRSKLQSLIRNLKYPPPSSVSIDYDVMKSIINDAFEKAIEEIINPVVERSITIASISTSQLISKDYACEVDEERYRSAAQQMVKSLASNLALVTCKEPLRMSITNYIRTPSGHQPQEQFMPEGAILMCVNDNLDLACSIIADSAEENSISEIDLIIEAELNDRRRHISQFPEQPYLHHNIPRWAQLIPEPFKQTAGGLNEVQQAVYDGFARTLHGVGTSHDHNLSPEASRQISEVVQDSIGVVNVSTPAEQPALPHQTSQTLDEARSLAQPPRLNGFTASVSPQERISSLLFDIQQNTRSSAARRLRDIESKAGLVAEIDLLLSVVAQSGRPPPELQARQLAETIGSSLFNEPKDQLESDVMGCILRKLCELSELTSRDVFRWLALQEDSLLTAVPVAIALVENGLIEFSRLDSVITNALHQREEKAFPLLQAIVEDCLLSDNPIALRSDFVGSLVAMNQWLADDPELSPAVDINNKLREIGVSKFVDVAVTDQQKSKIDQMTYIFIEWVKMFQNLSSEDQIYSSFLMDLHQKEYVSSQEESATFIRVCLDLCNEGFDSEAHGSNPSLTTAFLRTDALACLLIKLVKFQGETNGTIRIRKAPYLQSILSLIVLNQNHQQLTRGERFNQRIFFRLYSVLLYEYSSNGLATSDDHRDMMFGFAETFSALNPEAFPNFAYSWVMLISHRVFLAEMLMLQDEAGWNDYRKLIGDVLLFIGRLLLDPRNGAIAGDMNRGVMKVLLVLSQDFADFLCENYYYLCARVPWYCVSLRNLILGAYPQNQELPDLSNPVLKVERLDEMKRTPMIFGNPKEALSNAGLTDMLEHGLKKADLDVTVDQVLTVITSGTKTSIDSTIGGEYVGDIFESLALFICEDALASSGRFDPSSPHATFVTQLLTTLDEHDRYAFTNALIDQVRYPSTHMNYFSKLVLHLFESDQHENVIREVIIRVVLERLVSQRITMHPWGLTILFLELERNQKYRLWELPALAAAPQMRQLLLQIVRSH